MVHPLITEALQTFTKQSRAMKKRNFTYSFIHVILFLAILVFPSCDRSSIINTSDPEAEGVTSYEDVVALVASRTDQPSPGDVSDAFFKMMEEVQQMNREAIDSLSSEEILELGKPILDATNNTIKLSESTLQELGRAMQQWEQRIRSLTKSEHAALSQRAINAVKSDRDVSSRSLEVDEVRDILLNIHGGAATMSVTCGDLFNMAGGYVHVLVGDNLNVANEICPAGSIFYVYAGTHTGQSIEESKAGNTWVGVGSGGPVLDGQGTTDVAFFDGMAGNSISWMEIKNYTDWGIMSQSSSSSNIEIKNMTFRNIGGNRSGQDRAAIHFDNTENVLVQYSYFNNVSHSVRFRFSDGPLKVLNNEALNTGFGFFQCNKCDGSDIKINNNSLEHSTQYGTVPLRDFINIFDSEGSNSSNRIQINNNRARINLINGNASGAHENGCFIILGDLGGEHQEAKNNIGVNPGNCGIGTAGGSQFKVENNKIFSQKVDGLSNVGIYAAAYPSSVPCVHPPSTFSNNLSSFICGNSNRCDYGENNFAWAPNSESHQNYCGILKSDIQDDSRVKLDTDLDATIWNDW